MFRNVIQQTYNDVQDLDKAFGEIAMVTNYTVQDLWSQYDNYAAMANRLGQQTVSVIQASGLFYQQGLDTAEALALTEDTMKLATLAGLDFADATSQMTAAIRAFHMEMDEGSHVTDVYAELAAHAAADVKGIANAMSKTASIANSAGMSFENTATFLTTMIEAT
jgi:TP901 family phage tail tape measure protein